MRRERGGCNTSPLGKNVGGILQDFTSEYRGSALRVCYQSFVISLSVTGYSPQSWLSSILRSRMHYLLSMKVFEVREEERKT